MSSNRVPTLGDAAELAALIDTFHSAMLVTRAADGRFAARPMGILRRDPDDSLWFATLLDSTKTNDLAADPQSAVILHDGQDAPSWVSMSGSAAVSQDRSKIRELWRASLKLWFPEGPEQADLALIHFHPRHVEYMKMETGKVGAYLMALKHLVFKAPLPDTPKKQIELS